MAFHKSPTRGSELPYCKMARWSFISKSPFAGGGGLGTAVEGLPKLLVRRRFNAGTGFVVSPTSDEMDRDRCKAGGPLSEERRRRGGTPRGGNSRGLFSFLRTMDSGDEVVVVTEVTEDKLPVESTFRISRGGMLVSSVCCRWGALKFCAESKGSTAAQELRVECASATKRQKRVSPRLGWVWYGGMVCTLVVSQIACWGEHTDEFWSKKAAKV